MVKSFVLIATMIIGQLSTKAQSPDWEKETQQAMHRWGQCVRTSYVSQRRTTTDANLAVEAAFFSCRTEEENALSTLYSNPWIDRKEFDQLVAKTKAMLKQQLIAQP